MLSDLKQKKIKQQGLLLNVTNFLFFNLKFFTTII
jgi:hypothetical protein